MSFRPTLSWTYSVFWWYSVITYVSPSSFTSVREVRVCPTHHMPTHVCHTGACPARDPSLEPTCLPLVGGITCWVWRLIALLTTVFMLCVVFFVLLLFMCHFVLMLSSTYSILPHCAVPDGCHYVLLVFPTGSSWLCSK